MKCCKFFQETMGYLLNCRPDKAKALVDDAEWVSDIDQISWACAMLFQNENVIKQVNVDAVEVWEYAFKIGIDKDIISDEAIHLYDDNLNYESDYYE